jgi:hypothetical protein
VSKQVIITSAFDKLNADGTPQGAAHEQDLLAQVDAMLDQLEFYATALRAKRLSLQRR